MGRELPGSLLPREQIIFMEVAGLEPTNHGGTDNHLLSAFSSKKRKRFKPLPFPIWLHFQFKILNFRTKDVTFEF